MEDLERDGYVLSADPKRVDFARVHRWLAEESYWAAGRSYDLVARSIDGSLPYSVFTTAATTTTDTTTTTTALTATTTITAIAPAITTATGDGDGPALSPASVTATDRSDGHPGRVEQVAFARAVTDGATFAWICDVFVDEHHRGRGLGQWMIDTILADLSERGIQRFLLATKDAHDVYRRSGFSELVGADRFMEIDRRPTRNAILGQA